MSAVIGPAGASGLPPARTVARSASSPATTVTGVPPVTVGPELDRDEDLRINPPPPVDVRVVSVTARGVRLSWRAPDPVTVPHAYGDAVVGYRVYRRARGAAEFRFLAATRRTSFVDRTARPGGRYRYQVSDLRAHDVESGRSDPTASVTVPRD